MIDYDNWKLASPPHYEDDDEQIKNLTEAIEYNDFEDIQKYLQSELDIIYHTLKATNHGMTNRVLNLIKLVE